MDKDWPEDPEEYSRLDADLAEKDPADRDEEALNDIERRDTLTSIVDSVKPSPPPSPDVVYGDTDLNPNQEDETDAHEADPDDIP